MIRTALKTIFAHKLRLVLTAISVMIGVAFIAGTFIFTDTINQTFTDLFDDQFAGQDVIVQAEAEFDVGFGGPPPIEESVLDTVLGVQGVAAAEGNVGGFALIYDSNGEAIVPMGPPTIGASSTEDERLRGNIVIREGRTPAGPTEVVIDAKTAGDNGLVVGTPIQVQTVDGVAEYDLVGIVGFGDADNIAGATVAVFDLETAQTLFGLEGLYSGITVVGDEGVTPELLRNSIALALPEGVEAIVSADEAEAQAEALQESLGFLNTALLVFAAVAVFVAAFIIQNTFRIIVRQRQRELALIRAVGATGGQVVWMVAIEALIVGIFASVLGIALGFVISALLTAGMAAVGFDLPSTTASLAPRTIIIGLIVGVGVTLVAAILPAIRAARIPPVAALQDVDVRLRMSDRRRTIFGSILLVIGVGLILAGLFGDVIDLGPLNELTAVGIGALVVFLAVSMLSSLIVPSLARFLGWPLPKIDNLTGTLAIANAVRKPRRTATTASALMIGLALVAFFFILGDSIKASVSDSIEEGLRADYVISVDGFAGGFSPSLAEELKIQDEVETTTSLRIGFWDRNGSDEFLTAIEAETVDETIFLDVQDGSVAALVDGGVLVHEDVASDEGWVVGDTISMGFASTGLQEVEIVGIFGEQNIVQSNFLVGLEFYEANFSGFGSDTDFVVAVAGAENVDLAETRAVVEAAAAPYGNVTVRDQAEYRESQEAQIDTLLVLFNALLILAVIIALFGITNTLSLSIYERTREIGLLRAVGMTRPQTRRMIRWESIMVAVIGAILGIVVGLFFGIVVTAALKSQGINVLSIPAVQISGLVIFGVVAGLLAAIIPARRAAKLNILEAIAYE
ncbi:MAG: FtsX-like permease family protein [Acidimicrobiia bacterium]